jgi:large subunit ribosomal protein L6|tara:strand:- start:577 stop:1116 length:540 start_codon:yes stop_codon:yes gene_type:complete
MSRIGKQPIEVPAGVDVVLQGNGISVKGPKGELKLDINPEIGVGFDEGVVNVSRSSDETKHKALHGLIRSLIANMVEGVEKGFQKTLEIEGVGYRAEKKGSGLLLNLGFSHTIDYPAPEGVDIEVPNPTTIVIGGADKQAVGQAAAEIRAFRPPEPYKGKGIRYQGEYIRRKAGKTAGA